MLAVTPVPQDDFEGKSPKFELELDSPLAIPEARTLLAEPGIPAPFVGEAELTEDAEDAEFGVALEPMVLPDILLAALDIGLGGV